MGVVEVPVGTEKLKRDFLQEVVNEKPAGFVRGFFPMEDTQAAFRSCVYLSLPACYTPVLSTCPLQTNSRCGKERRILIGPW